jgi:spore maturation protein CgeB
MVYRYLEVLASGSLLLAPDVPGILNYFTPGIHFVAFGSVGEAADKATYYLSAPSEADQISRQGHMRAKALVESRAFWLQINSALGPVGFF